MNKSHWMFIGAVVLQLFILAAVPAGRAYALATGTTVFLKTAPVDPYSIMSGYHVILGYDISTARGIPGFPGTTEGTFYVVLEAGADGFWHAVSADANRPATAPPSAVVIKGRSNGWRVTYGIESYFIPEGKGAEIEQGLRENRDTTRVEVKVDSFGHAALVRLHVGDKTYEY